ncbi:MAG: tetratricopeptide repeat protein [Clostridia bacterium]
MKPGLLALVIAIFACPVIAQQAFSLKDVYAQGPVPVSEARDIMERAVEAVESQYLPYYAGIQTAKPKLSLILNEEPLVAIVKAEVPDRTEESAVFYWSSASELEALLPAVVFSLWARLAGLADNWMEEPPLPSFEMSLTSTSALLGTDLGIPQNMASLAPAPGGGIFAAGMGYAVELDSRLSPRAVHKPDPKNAYVFLYQIASSRSGNLYALASTGESWLLKRGSLGFERGPTIQPLPMGIGAASDGGIVYMDSTTMNFMKVDGRRRSSLPMQGTKPLSSAPFDIDDDGRFWMYDYVSGMVKSFEADGTLVGALRILPGPGDTMTPLRLHVRNSEIILSGATGISAWNRHGLPLWTLPAPSPQADPSRMANLMSSTVDGDGALYLLLSTDLTISRYDDQRSIMKTAGTQGPEQAEAIRRMIELNKIVLASPDDEDAYADRADQAQVLESATMELSLRTVMKEAFPGNLKNTERLEGLRREIARVAVLAEAERVKIPLARYGAETARADFQKAMRGFEVYLAENPDDQEAMDAMISLGDAFRARENGAFPQRRQPLKLEASIQPLFPAFMERYRTVPAGIIRITNPGPLPVSSLRVDLMIKDFMDYPVRIEHEGLLEPGTSVELPALFILNRTVLDLREEVSVMVSMSASASANPDTGSSSGPEASPDRTKPDGSATADGNATAGISILARTALSWEDSAALAAFVTPNDDSIVDFTHAALARPAPLLFGKSFSRTFAIVNALGARGLVYVEDPRTPFSAVGGTDTLDTVRFPRATLTSGAGDCDDSSALLASCLEAAGVPSAILTTPGHVLVAFRADAPPDGPGRYDAPDFGIIEHDGEYWIPLESTVLSKGFAEVWKAGWREIQRAGTSLELIPLAQARLSYPALPLPGTPAGPVLPSAEALAQLAQKSLDSMTPVWLAPFEAAVRDAKPGRPKAAACNDLGVRLAQLGKYQEAVKAIHSAISADPGFPAPRANLVSVLLASGQDADARKALADGLAALPDSPAIKRIAQRLNASTPLSANPSHTETSTTGAEPTSIGIAPTGSDSGARASNAVALPDFVWGDD